MKFCKIISVWFGVVTVLTACALPSVDDLSQSDDESFFVVTVQPNEGTLNSAKSEIILTFSAAVEESTISKQSLFVVKEADYLEEEGDWDDLADGVLEESYQDLVRTRSVEQDGFLVRVTLDATLLQDGDYVVLATPLIQDQSRRSLDQRSNQFDQRNFTGRFSVILNSPSNDVSQESTVSENTAPQYPQSESEYTSDSSNADDEKEVQEPVADFNWNRVLITELVTDPQQDHGESSPGNGVVFDSAAGSGTIGSNDEYIEIYNGTEESVDLSSWTLKMNDGTDEEQSLGDENTETYFSAGGASTLFQPGEFMVIGNPSGAMNNSITVQLFNEEDALVDEVSVEDANADAESDEAYTLQEDGHWEMDFATPGGF
ncbi:MAG: lamin tail domain-containing protein [Deltaproteobacteria bacterium]|nr:lamin tail domain-containing protein [Deltaproteobacteria bacterium]